jgi:tetratricopeptide (TPR) repeat protein
LLYQNDWSFDLSHRYPIGLRLYRACVRQYGRYHQETLYWLDNLAEAARSIERMSEATKACRSAYDDSVRVLGREHPQTVKRLKSLIESLMDSRDYHEAERLCRQRIRIVGTQVPSDSEAMWRERQKLAEICVHTNKSAESEAIFRSILVAQEREFGPISIETGEACNNLGVALARKGEFAEAETLFLRAFESFEAGMTMKFMQTPRYLPSFPYDFGKQPIFAHNLGVLYYTKKDYAAALSFAEDGESAYVGFVFPAHQYQKDYLNYLAFLRVKVGLPPNYPHQPQPRKR